VRALELAWSKSTDAYQRAHVAPYMYQNPQLFKVLAIKGEKDYSSLRWTLDTQEDLEFLRAVYSRFPGRDDFEWRDVLSVLEREPHLSELNRNVAQKDMHEG
jgi:spore coat polysaccharide biosynthesis protein SpsF